MYIYSYLSPLGEITLASNGYALTGLWFVGQKYYGENMEGKQTAKVVWEQTPNDDCETGTPSVFLQTVQWLDIYFSGKKPNFMPEISLSGTPFQMEVWEILKTIPYGQTVTYGEIAARIAEQRGIRRMSAQAVGGAVSRNPVSILVPCHRVVGTDGSLTGYAGGMARKTSLLKLEGVDMAALFSPRRRNT